MPVPMTTPPLIRRYHDDDWPRLCEIHDAARLDELRHSVGLGAFLTLAQTAQGEGLFDGELWVAQVDARVQGFVAWNDGELTWLYVDPAAGRRGIGRALLRHALAAHAGHLDTEVLEGNVPALVLYLGEGFRVRRRVEGRLAGNEGHRAVGYVLAASPASAAVVAAEASHSATA